MFRDDVRDETEGIAAFGRKCRGVRRVVTEHRAVGVVPRQVRVVKDLQGGQGIRRDEAVQDLLDGGNPLRIQGVERIGNLRGEWEDACTERALEAVGVQATTLQIRQLA